MSVHSAWNYFSMSKFGWTAKEVGISLAVVGVCFGVVQGAATGLLVKKLGEKGAATLGLGVLFITLIGISFIPSDMGWMMYLIILPYALSGIVDPAIRTIVSKGTTNNEQGELQGVFTSMMSLGEIIGPQLFMWIFYTSRTNYPNEDWSYASPFLAASIFALAAFFILRWTLKEFKR